MSKVLFVDGLKKTLDLYVDFAGLEGIEALAVSNGVEALSAINSDNGIKVVVTGIKFGKIDSYGLILLEEIKKRHPDRKVIVYSTYNDDKTISAAKSLGADLYLAKSEGIEMLFQKIKAYL